MVMSDPNRIDAILKSPEGEIVLMISEHRDWRIYSEMREQLRQKISNYIKYINSDGYRSHFGITTAKIILMTNYEPTQEIKQDLMRYEQARGIKIEYQTMPTV
jgi:hypothetical protein